MTLVCETCCFFNSQLFSDTLFRGECRRYPPKVWSQVKVDVVVSSSAETAFPIVLKDDWCGEWGPRVEKGKQK